MTGGEIAVAHRLRVPPPSADALVRWPEGFGQRFVVTADVEEEFDWTQPFSDRARSVEAIAALPATHARLRDRGVGPLYLVDHPIATDARATAILRECLADGRSAIGTQLHPWVNPPHAEAATPIASFAGNLPPSLEADKLDRLTDAIRAAFGAAPLAYRAGRYGIGPATFALLAERGYRIDTSVRARHDYSPEGGPDFRAVGNAAYRSGPRGRIVELPLTTVFIGAARRWGAPLHRAAGAVQRGRGVLARGGIVSRVPLTPEGTPLADAQEAIRVACDDGLALLNLSFHSPSLVPGNTPYVRDAADLARFHAWWEGVLDLLDRRGVRPASLAEILAAAG